MNLCGPALQRGSRTLFKLNEVHAILAAISETTAWLINVEVRSCRQCLHSGANLEGDLVGLRSACEVGIGFEALAEAAR